MLREFARRILGNYFGNGRSVSLNVINELPPVSYRQPGVEPPIEVKRAGFDTGRPFDYDFQRVVALPPTDTASRVKNLDPITLETYRFLAISA